MAQGLRVNPAAEDVHPAERRGGAVRAGSGPAFHRVAAAEDEGKRAGTEVPEIVRRIVERNHAHAQAGGRRCSETAPRLISGAVRANVALQVRPSLAWAVMKPCAAILAPSDTWICMGVPSKRVPSSAVTTIPDLSGIRGPDDRGLTWATIPSGSIPAVSGIFALRAQPLSATWHATHSTPPDHSARFTEDLVHVSMGSP